MYDNILNISCISSHKYTLYMQAHLSQVYEGFSVSSTSGLAEGNLYVYNQMYICVEDVWT